MKIQVILSLILFIVVLVITQPKSQEGFNPYDTCIGQGYPTDWCLRTAAPGDPADPCTAVPVITSANGLGYNPIDDLKTSSN